MSHCRSVRTPRIISDLCHCWWVYHGGNFTQTCNEFTLRLHSAWQEWPLHICSGQTLSPACYLEEIILRVHKILWVGCLLWWSSLQGSSCGWWSQHSTYQMKGVGQCLLVRLTACSHQCQAPDCLCSLSAKVHCVQSELPSAGKWECVLRDQPQR